MRSSSRVTRSAAPGVGAESQPSPAPNPAAGARGDKEQAAVGPMPQPVSAADNPLPRAPADVPAEAEGRRILSTAYVRVGADGLLTVHLRSGRVLVLRDVVMRPKDFCGVEVPGSGAGSKYCGGYAEVAAARPGGAAASQQPDLAVSKPLGSAQDPGKRD